MAFKPRLKVPGRLTRTMNPTAPKWRASAVFATDLLREVAGRDLSEVDVLDVGCGTKTVKALHDLEIDVASYTGVDVERDVIEWLSSAVTDPRYEFHHLDAHNEMYNPGGRPLQDFDLLPVGERTFDLVCLFSVFTHLNPEDFEAMLRLLRRHAHSGTRLLFSLYVTRPDGSGVYLAAGQSPPGARFVDEIPDRPLAVARYDPDYARELTEAAGWSVESLNPPREHIQHYVIATPA